MNREEVNRMKELGWVLEWLVRVLMIAALLLVAGYALMHVVLLRF